jgi:AbrB family looped-hinge helix DNA binding protein
MEEGSALTKVTRNGQVTLPASLRRAVNIEVGDYIEVTVQDDGLLLTPKKLIDKSQAYFWTEEWQKGERQADEDKKAGRSVSFASAEEAAEFLRLRDKDAH